MDLQLRDRRVVVAGASGMLGAACARAFALEGARLALIGRSAEKLAALQSELVALGAAQPLVLPADLTMAEATEASISRSLRELGGIDAFVAAAGAAQGGLFWEIGDAAWRSNLELKLFGTIRLLRAVVPHMVQAGHGRIVVIAGNSGRQPEPRMLPGAVANAGLLALVRGLAEEIGPSGVTINAVNPGPVRSSRWENMMRAEAERAGSTPEAVEKGYLAKSALRRIATPEDVAAAVSFLASERAVHITGTTLTVDGGMTKA